MVGIVTSENNNLKLGLKMSFLTKLFELIFPKEVSSNALTLEFIRNNTSLVKAMLTHVKVASWDYSMAHHGIKYMKSLDGKLLAMRTDGGTVTYYLEPNAKIAQLKTEIEVENYLEKYGWSIY